MARSYDRFGIGGTDPAQVALATGVALLMIWVAAETATAMAYVGGLFVAAGFLLGPAAPLGGLVGLVLHDLIRGAIGYPTLTLATWILVFTGLVAWLTGPTTTTSERLGGRSVLRERSNDILLIATAGTYGTAVTAWLVMLLGRERFYTAALDFLPGVVVAAGISAAGLITADAIRRLGASPERDGPLGRLSFEPERLDRDGSAGRTSAALVGTFLIGVAWVGSASALDVFVHDLELFATASQFRAFITGFLGSSSPIATVGTSLFVGLYRYGELAVLLSAPATMLALWAWNSARRRTLSSVFSTVKTIGWGSTR